MTEPSPDDHLVKLKRLASACPSLNLSDPSQAEVAHLHGWAAEISRVVHALNESAEQFLQSNVDRAPEPLRRLGEYLAGILHDAEWDTAERLLLAATASVELTADARSATASRTALSAFREAAAMPRVAKTEGGMH